MPSTQAQIHNTLPAEREVSGEENPRKSSEQVMAGILFVQIALLERQCLTHTEVMARRMLL
jgi:hypothetical protein